MTQIEKYIERLKTLQNLYDEGQPQHNAFGIAIVEANEMLVKNCSIPDVSHQRELLRFFDSFFEWHKEQGYVSIKRDDFEEYLKTLNCG